jgi:hypothetical protein
MIWCEYAKGGGEWAMWLGSTTINLLGMLSNKKIESQPINTTIIMAAWRCTKTNWDGVAGVFVIRNTKN